MACGCRELEEQYGEGDCKCVHYKTRFPLCKCEEESTSEHSPGQVAEHEVLIRTIFNDEHVDEYGYVKVGYFRTDPKTRGMSVNRRGHVTAETLRQRMEADPKNRHGYLGYAGATFGDIKNLKSQQHSRFYCVYDTALIDDPSHADVCHADVFPAGSDRLEMATTLARVFGKVTVNLADIYER